MGKPYHETIWPLRPIAARAVGAAGVAWFSVPQRSLRYTAAEPTIYRSSPKVQRGFCNVCGTSLTYETTDHKDEIDRHDFHAGTIPRLVAPVDHSYTSGRVRWEIVCDGMPAYPYLRPAEHRKRAVSRTAPRVVILATVMR